MQCRYRLVPSGKARCEVRTYVLTLLYTHESEAKLLYFMLIYVIIVLIMEILSKPTSSLEDIAALVTSVEELVDGGVPLQERKDVMDLLWVLEHRVSSTASQLMTGFRSEKEKQAFADTLSQLRRLTEAITLDIAYRAYDESGDSGKTIKAILAFLEEVLADTVEADYEKRLDYSMFERLKQWFAHRGNMSKAASIGLSGAATLVTAATTAYIWKSGGDVPMSDFDTLRQGGLFGVAAALGAVAVGAIKKNGPRTVGRVVGGKVHASYETYVLEQHSLRDGNGAHLSAEALMEKYAERDLGAVIPTVALRLIDADIDSREDLAPLTEKVLDVAEISILQSYGVDFEESWLKQVASQLYGDDAIDYYRYNSI